MVFADATVSGQTAALRSSGRDARQLDRLHAGTARRSGEAPLALQDGTDLHAASRQQEGRTARVVSIVGRHELAGQRLRSGNARAVCSVVHVARADWIDADAVPSIS